MVKLNKLNRKLLLAVAAVIIIALVLFFWLHKPAKMAIIPTVTPAATKQTNSATSNSSKTQTGSGSTATPSTGSTKTTPAATASAASLANPYGSFVSSHHVTLGGSAVLEQSTCNTTPGASCYIKFSKDGITRSLATETIDSSGVASWTWNVQQAGLTSGSWQITATATLGDQTKSTSDSMPLEVQ